MNNDEWGSVLYEPEAEPQAAPDPDRHPCVVQTDYLGNYNRLIVVTVAAGEAASGIQFAETLGRDLANDLTPILVMRDGWSIDYFDPLEGTE